MAPDRGTETKAGAPFKGILLNAGDKRQEVVGKIGKHRGKRLFFFFNGIVHRPIQFLRSNFPQGEILHPI